MVESKSIKFQVVGYTEVIFTVDDEYFIKPLNPQKLKHRDRECRITGFNGNSAKVKFLDNGCVGKVELSDLILSAGAIEDK